MFLFGVLCFHSHLSFTRIPSDVYMSTIEACCFLFHFVFIAEHCLRNASLLHLCPRVRLNSPNLPCKLDYTRHTIPPPLLFFFSFPLFQIPSRLCIFYTNPETRELPKRASSLLPLLSLFSSLLSRCFARFQINGPCWVCTRTFSC